MPPKKGGAAKGGGDKEDDKKKKGGAGGTAVKVMITHYQERKQTCVSNLISASAHVRTSKYSLALRIPFPKSISRAR